MNYRISKLLARKSFTADNTETIDINIADVISFINIQFGSVCADNVNDNTPMDALTNIEVVDGSKVLFSLDGVEAEAIDWYHRGGRSESQWNMYLTGNTLNRSVNINFGRFKWDPLFALDPKMFNNLQLRITQDISAGGNSPATTYLTVNAGVFDEKVVSPQGFLMFKEHKQYTMASTVHEYTELPTDHPYRNLYFRAVLAGTEPVQCVSNIKLSEDNDKRIPYDLDARELARQIQGNYPSVEELVYSVCQTSQTTIYCMPTTGVVAQVCSWAAAVAELNVGSYDGDGGRLYLDAATASGNVQVLIKGSIPHCVFQLPMGLKDEPDDWFNPAGLRSLKLDITGAAASQGYICSEQMMAY